MNLVPVLASAGALVGAASQTLLTRLRRGASVHKGWCAGGLAVLWAIAGWRTEGGHLSWWWLPIPLVVAWFAVTLTVVDLKHRRLPNALTLAAYPAIALATTMAATQSGWQTMEGALLGGAALATMYLAIHLTCPRAMGGGDVKLSGSQGAVMGAVGWPAVLVGTTLAAVLTLALNATAPKHRRETWRTGIPHAPALLAATYLTATFPAIQG